MFAVSSSDSAGCVINDFDQLVKKFTRKLDAEKSLKERMILRHPIKKQLTLQCNWVIIYRILFSQPYSTHNYAVLGQFDLR